MGLKKDTDGRLHIDTPLMAESLMDRTLLQKTETEAVFRPLPNLNVIKLGGQSIMDRGGQVVLPLVEEITAARTKYQIARHASCNDPCTERT
jgi:molybdenum storage protein